MNGPPESNSALLLKATALRAVTGSGVASLFRPLTRNAAVVFMLHRFCESDPDVRGYDPKTVRRLLAYLRREKHQLVDLGTLFASLSGEAPPLRHPVVFTIDDGYREHAEIACPLFAEFDCPVTTFVATGFLDGALWFWWDQVQYVFTRSQRRSIELDLHGRGVRYELTDRTARVAASDHFTGLCTAMPEPGKLAAIARLAVLAEVELPAVPPPSFAPMSWDQLRSCERQGMTFAPHTVTHPVLARTDDQQARVEIEGSWQRLREEASLPVPIFAYPNGQPGDFGEREYRIMREVGIRGAVTGVAGFATAQRHARPDGAFLIPRFPFPDSMPYLVQQVDGLERFKFLLRGMN